jgi:hypothetical protein
VVEERVRPFREARTSTKADATHAAAWWRFANTRPELASATRNLSHVIAIPRMSVCSVAARIPTGTVFSDQLVVVASSSFAVLALLSSVVHGAWARFTCSTLGRGIRYTPSDTFETFAMPFETFEALERNDALLERGREFHEARAAFLSTHGIGLSALRRLLADPRAPGSDLKNLRRIVAELDRAVFSAYGFRDLDPVEVTDHEVVARLFVLNADRAARSARHGPAVGSAQHRPPVE